MAGPFPARLPPRRFEQRTQHRCSRGASQHGAPRHPSFLSLIHRYMLSENSSPNIRLQSDSSAKLNFQQWSSRRLQS